MHDHPPTRSVPPDSDEIDGYPAHLLPPYHLDETPTHGHETAPTSRPPGPTGGVPFGPHSNSINEYPPHLLPPYSLEGTHSPPPGHETAATLRQKKIIKYVGGGLGLSIIAGVTGLGVYEGIHNAHKGHNTTKRTFEAFEGQANVKLAERALGGPR
jgi:hypothetical protein